MKRNASGTGVAGIVRNMNGLQLGWEGEGDGRDRIIMQLGETSCEWIVVLMSTWINAEFPKRRMRAVQGEVESERGSRGRDCEDHDWAGKGVQRTESDCKKGGEGDKGCEWMRISMSTRMKTEFPEKRTHLGKG